MISADMLLAAVDVATIAYWTWIVIKVAIGLGAVIFVHELGHFLVAKLCGVKCEKFFIGFDIGGYKISRRWGETEYGIGILPLGGYVKMLGQDDDPSHIAEQMQKSQVNANSPDAVQVTGPRGEKYWVDRRSYLAKSVPQRMAIISAGVIMNVIFAFIFATVAYGMGVPYMPSIVAETVPGSPAWEEGLEPGDEIIQLGNQKDPTFMQLKGSVTLGDAQSGIPCVIRRAKDDKVVNVVLTPDQSRGRLQTIGIVPSESIEIAESMPAIKGSPADRAELVELTGESENLRAAAGPASAWSAATPIRVGETEIKSYRDWQAALASRPHETLRITLERTQKGKPKADGQTAPTTFRLRMSYDVSPRKMRRFGLVMKMGPIVSVRKDSPAHDKIVPGDVIEMVDGQPISGADGVATTWDAFSLPEVFRKAATDGREVEVTLVRGGSDQGPDRVTVRVTPIVPTEFFAQVERAPLGVPALGIAYEVQNEIVAVTPDSPAERMDLRPGDRLIHAKVILPKKEDPGDELQTIEFDIGAEKPNLPAIHSLIQTQPEGTKVEFTVERKGNEKPHKVVMTTTDVEGFFVAERGFVFKPIVKTRKAATFSERLRYGRDETVDALLMVYRFLQKLGDEVPLTALGGPVSIAGMAGSAASEGLPTLLIFLTMLSANLAVLNFLPIPLLDGGHMVFLLYEGIRGRPANERFVVAMHIIGFAFIVTLMLFVLGLDVGLIDRGL
jgi:regulator of sigma E protease